MTWTLRAPVAFLIFNRPDKAKRVFEQIAKARPRKLFVIGDGPRPDRPGEGEKVRLTRAIIDNVDWDCEVLTNYSDVNLGMTERTVSGLNWVFENTEEVIFLEDDCLPHSSFFRFCDELLEKYRDDERIMMVSGDNIISGRRVTRYSYFCSRYTGTWGWATWRRAWQHYDVNMALWPMLRNTPLLEDMLGDKTSAAVWRGYLDRVAAGDIRTWDFQWIFNCWTQNGLSVLPATNLISNIGFGPDATYLVAFDPALANLPAIEMTFPLQHPPYLARNLEADRFISRHAFGCAKWTNRPGIARVIRRFFPTFSMRKMAANLRAKTLRIF